MPVIIFGSISNPFDAMEGIALAQSIADGCQLVIDSHMEKLDDDRKHLSQPAQMLGLAKLVALHLNANIEDDEMLALFFPVFEQVVRGEMAKTETPPEGSTIQ